MSDPPVKFVQLWYTLVLFIYKDIDFLLGRIEELEELENGGKWLGLEGVIGSIMSRENLMLLKGE